VHIKLRFRRISTKVLSSLVEESSFFALDSHQQLSGFSPDSLPFESSGDDVAHDQNVRTIIPCFGPRRAMARAFSRPFVGHEISR